MSPSVSSCGVKKLVGMGRSRSAPATSTLAAVRDTGQVHRRVRLLQRPGRNGQPINLIVVAVVGEVLGRPQAQDNVQRLVESRIP